MKSGTSKEAQTMTKQDLIRASAKAAGVTQETAAAVLTAALEAAADAIADGEPVKVMGFGTLEVRRHKAGTSHNFATGETIQRKPRNVVVFTASETMKQRVNAMKGDKQ